MRNEWNWEPYPLESPIEPPDWLGPFTQRTSVLIDTIHFEPANYFDLFFWHDVIRLLVRETNDYASTKLQQLPDTNFWKQRWKPTNAGEMRAFIGLQIAMGIFPTRAMEDYWGYVKTNSVKRCHATGLK